MNIKPGYYRTRDGQKAEVVYVNRKKRECEQVFGYVRDEDAEWSTIFWYLNGLYFAGGLDGNDPLDLIAPWEDEVKSVTVTAEDIDNAFDSIFKAGLTQTTRHTTTVLPVYRCLGRSVDMLKYILYGVFMILSFALILFFTYQIGHSMGSIEANLKSIREGVEGPEDNQ